MKFHHLGIACENIQELTSSIVKTFNIIRISEIFYLDNQGVYVCLLTNDDGTNIELVSGEKVNNFVKKNQFLYHHCWEVDDINSAIDNFCANGSSLIMEPKPSKLFDNRKVAFLYTDIGILELLETNINAIQ